MKKNKCYYFLSSTWKLHRSAYMQTTIFDQNAPKKPDHLSMGHRKDSCLCVHRSISTNPCGDPVSTAISFDSQN